MRGRPTAWIRLYWLDCYAQRAHLTGEPSLRPAPGLVFTRHNPDARVSVAEYQRSV